MKLKFINVDNNYKSRELVKTYVNVDSEYLKLKIHIQTTIKNLLQ